MRTDVINVGTDYVLPADAETCPKINLRRLTGLHSQVLQ